MEPKKIKKLVLNQEVISTLSEDKMNNIKGAGTDPWLTCPTGLTGVLKCCPKDDETGDDYDEPGGTGESCGTCAGVGSGYAGCCNYTNNCGGGSGIAGCLNWTQTQGLICF